MRGLLAAAAATAVAAFGPYNLIMLPQDDMSSCLDGSPYGIYWSPGTGNGTTNWMVYFQGGGWCYSEADCYGRSKGSLGSSTKWAKTSNPMGGLMSDDCTANPQFCTWNKVWMPYCDGNSFSGQLTEPVSFYGNNLYFRGHYNMRAAFNAIMTDVVKAPVPYSQAADIMLTGCSAGGLSTYLHADYVAANFIKPNRPSPPGQSRPGYYGAVPVSGFFLDAPNVDGQHIYRDEIQVINALSNASAPGGTNDACLAANPGSNAWKCNMAPYVYQYITTPIFPLNSAYDSWQTGCILTSEPVSNLNNTQVNGNCSAVPGWYNCSKSEEACTPAQISAGYNPYRAQFIAAMNATNTAGKRGNGGFINSCHTHCEGQGGGYDTYAIGGITMQQAVTAWWNSAGTAPAVSNWHWDCQYTTTGAPFQCNPTCGSN
jgi:hypothetical protein